MMLQAYASAGRVLEREEDLEAAVRNAGFLLAELRPGRRLKRTWRDGAARIDAFLEDHALLADALLSLYEATFDPRWVAEARELGDGSWNGSGTTTRASSMTPPQAQSGW
jgi:uncharacterized protein